MQHTKISCNIRQDSIYYITDKWNVDLLFVQRWLRVAECELTLITPTENCNTVGKMSATSKITSVAS